MSQENSSSSNAPLLWSFLAGVAAGAVLAALVTPRSGPETRKNLLDLGKRATDQTKAFGQQVVEALAKVKSETLQTLADLKRGIQETAHAGADGTDPNNQRRSS